MNIANISFSEAGFKEFEKLPRVEQISYISKRLNPNDEVRAEKLLKDGNIRSGVATKKSEDNTTDVASKSNGASGDRQKPGAKESKD